MNKFLPLLFFLALSIQAQVIEAQGLNPVITGEEKLSYIGMTIAEVIERFGSPTAVAAARGNETWQDDVIFQYPNTDFYIFKDRVWQVKFSSVCGINLRDRKAAVMLLLGDSAEDKENYSLLSIHGKSWPITLRVNFNNTGRAGAEVSAIYIYRPDF